MNARFVISYTHITYKSLFMKNKAFNDQILEYQQILKNLARRFTTDHEEINDLIQETFIRSLKFMDQYVDNPRVVSWLFVIMRNIYINQYKRQSYKNQYEELSMHYNSYHISAEPLCEEVFDKRMMLEDISTILEEMPDAHSKIFNHYIDGYKYRELSDMYGIPEGTIKSRIHIIRKTLQKTLSVKYNN